MGPAHLPQVVQGGGHVDRERQVLLLLQPAVAPDQAGEPRAVDVLEHDVRPVPVLPVAEPLTTTGWLIVRRASTSRRSPRREDSSSTWEGRSTLTTTADQVTSSKHSQAS